MNKSKLYKIGNWIFRISLLLWVPAIILGWIGIIPFFFTWICIGGEGVGILIKQIGRKKANEIR